MAILPDIFKPDTEESDPFAPIPAGWYTAELVQSVLKATKDGTGKYLAFKFNVVEGDHAGRFIFTNLNIVNKSDMAVRIAKSDLKAICEATGHSGELEDTDDLHGIPLEIKVSVTPETSQWPAKNEIKKYRAEQ